MKYEYKVVNIVKFKFEKYAEKLNEYGSEGWKLVCVESSMHYFIKELKDGTF